MTSRKLAHVVCIGILAASMAVGIAGSSPPIGDARLFDVLDANEDGRVVADEISAEHARLFDRLLRRGDANGDQALSRNELTAALTPTRPEKPIEVKQPATSPQADAVRWILLSMDTSRNARIERSEVPDELQRVFSALLEPIDTNKNDVLETIELSRGGRPLARIAMRYVEQRGIDVAAELRKLERQQGQAANRFEAGPLRPQDLADPEKARGAFRRLDANGDGQIEMSEVPDQLQRPVRRLLRTADRDGDGRLSQREFITGARRVFGRAARQTTGEMPVRDAVANESMPANEK